MLGLKRDDRPCASTPVLEAMASSSVGGDLFPQDAFDLGDLFNGFLHPLTDGASQDDAELAFIGDRKELGSDERQQGE